MAVGEELKRAKAALAGPVLSSGSHTFQGLRDAASTPEQLAQEGADDHGLPVLVPDSADAEVRQLAAVAKRYSQSSVQDFETVYAHGLTLQELATKMDTTRSNQLALLSQASERYEAATRLRPTSHAALYNWGVALSDMARVVRSHNKADSTSYLMAAAEKYAASLRWQPNNPQALNNWGLVLQELAAARPPAERVALVALSSEKFRRAMALRPEFDRACYNLGTVFYAHACSLQQSAQQHLSSALTQDAGDVERESVQEATVRSAFELAAQYIVLAAMLQPSRDVYRRSLGVVQPLLPLPYLRSGTLLAASPPAGSLQERWAPAHFVVDHESFRSSPPPPGSGAQPGLHSDLSCSLSLDSMTGVQCCSDPSLPRGSAFWVRQSAQPSGLFFVAETSEDAQAWVDVLLILQHLSRLGQQASIAACLQPPGSD